MSSGTDDASKFGPFTKTTTVTTVVQDGKTVRTTETVTSSEGGDVDFAEVEQAMKEHSEAMKHAFDGFGERMSKVFEPFDRLFKKKPTTEKVDK